MLSSVVGTAEVIFLFKKQPWSVANTLASPVLTVRIDHFSVQAHSAYYAMYSTVPPDSAGAWSMSRLTRDGTAEPVSRDQTLRRERGQGNVHVTCSADHG